MGFGPCELVQIELASKIKKYDVVNVDFWFSPRSSIRDTKINMYLMKSKGGNFFGNIGDCDNPSIDFIYHRVINVNSSGVNALHIPGTWYHYSTQILSESDDEIGWIAIKGDNHDGQLNDCEYLYVDDVSVRKFPVCAHACMPSLGKLKHSTIPTAMCGNTNASCSPCNNTNCVFPACCQTFRVLIENAIGIEFIMFNKYGAEFYHFNSFDPNGLKNPGFNDFLLEWNGNNDQGNNVQQDVYVIYLRMWNCSEEIKIVGDKLTVFPPSKAAFVIPEIHEGIPDCCPDFEYYQNRDFTGTFRKNVDDFIIAWANVIAGTTGPVVVKNGADVTFAAGNRIVLEPGFSTETGAKFIAKIDQCGTPGKMGPISRWDQYEVAKKENNNKGNAIAIGNSVEFSPNPFFQNTRINYSLKEKSHIELTIKNTLGQTLFRLAPVEITEPGIHTIAFGASSLPAAIYFLTFTVRNETGDVFRETKKLVKLQ